MLREVQSTSARSRLTDRPFDQLVHYVIHPDNKELGTNVWGLAVYMLTVGDRFAVSVHRATSRGRRCSGYRRTDQT